MKQIKTHENRQWPPPAGGWAVAMQWHDLLFAHWRVDVAQLRPLVPDGLAIDTFDGSAWVAVTPFAMTGVRPRLVPPLPGLSQFLELNVRTYVTAEGKPGVWFFSLDAASALAVQAARKLAHLPYYNADMKQVKKDDGFHYESRRTDRDAVAATFAGRYRPRGEVFRAHQSQVEYWLTERYCLYAQHQDRLLREEIHHAPWPLQAAEAVIEDNTMLRAAGVAVDDPCKPALLHYAPHLEVVAWWPQRVAV